MATVIQKSRRVLNNDAILDQADFFQGNGFDRQSGISIVQVTAKIFRDNKPQPWPVVDGTPILSNTQVSAGSIYWNEIPNASGFYSVRWRPTATGYWRLILTYPTGSQTIQLDYDVFSESSATIVSGIQASFSKP